MRSLRCCAYAAFCGLSYGEDTVALLQQSVAPHVAAEAAMEALVGEHREMIDAAPQLLQMMNDLTPSSYISENIEGSKQNGEHLKGSLAKGWKALHAKATEKNYSDPRALLQSVKAVLLETGAMEEMRQMAMATANASRASSKGAVPLDSMMVGFRTSVAPWNNLLRMFAMPLVKASFTIFTNFFGPQGNAARLCMGAQVAADSTYGVHTRSEFGGINVWVGPAKWDNVPGWSFGTSGGIDDVRAWDVADFGWSWTLAKVPETVGFFWDALVIDDETIHAGMLQTAAETLSEKSAEIPRHGSTWIQHVWCSPHWENTPLVLPDEAGAAPPTQMVKTPAASEPKEEWDPDSEAV